MTHRGPFQLLTFCDSVIWIFFLKHEFWKTKGKYLTNKALSNTGNQSEDPDIEEIQLSALFM